ncbi:MAG: Fic family protein [Oligoflexia bacterium]|nr:Fic family protein [Oligoflexia bacterium]MBF0366891.1 Fic family protein [Oligoflexia bacterium]
MKKFVAKIPAIRKKCHPVEAAAMIYKELVDIHPFIDGNGLWIDKGLLSFNKSAKN